MRLRERLRPLSRWANRSIQRKLLFWNIGFWVFSVSVLSLAFLLIGQSEVVSETRQRNVQLASIIARDVNAQMSGINSDIRIFSRRLEESATDINSQTETLIALRASSPQRYRSIYYFDNRGGLVLYLAEPLATLLSMAPNDILSRPPINPGPDVLATYRMVTGEGIYFSDVYFTSLERTPVIFAGIPVTPSGSDKKVIVIELDLRDIWRRVDLTTIGETGFAYVVSGTGLIITHRDAAMTNTPIAKEIEPVLSDFEGFTGYIEPSSQTPVFAAFSPVGGATGWGVVVEQERAEAMAPIYRITALVVAVWVLLAILGTVSIWLLVRSFTRPIIELTRTTKEIGRTGILKKTAMEERPDEVGELSAAFDQMIERLKITENKVATAAVEERNRLARDLHDAVSQTLFSASLIAEVLPRLWERNQPEGRKRLDEVRQLTRGALAEMRTLLLELRPSALVDTELGDLMHQLAESITGRARVPVTVTNEGEGIIPTEVKVAFYRIAQEALNNIAKYAGAKQARISLLSTAEQVTLKVSDDGKGFDPASIRSDSLGLGIMRERAKGIGALLTVQSRRGSGTDITVIWENTHRGK